MAIFNCKLLVHQRVHLKKIPNIDDWPSGQAAMATIQRQRSPEEAGRVEFGVHDVCALGGLERWTMDGAVEKSKYWLDKWENHRKTIGQWENHRKTIGKWRFTLW